MKAFEVTGDSAPVETEFRKGRIWEVTDDGFQAIVYDESYSEPRVIEMPLRNILASEIGKIVPGRLVHCYTTVPDGEGNVSIRSIEFIEEPPLNL